MPPGRELQPRKCLHRRRVGSDGADVEEHDPHRKKDRLRVRDSSVAAALYTSLFLFELLGDPDREKSQRVMRAMLEMKKIDIGARASRLADVDV